MPVALVIPNWPAEAAEADDALGMFIALRRQGADVRVFTPDGQSSLPIDVGHYDDLGYLFGQSDDLIIYHRSAGDQIALPYLNRLQCRLIVRYHGTAPAASMLPFSEPAARAARRQRLALQATAQLPADAFLAATNVQAAELQKLGVPASRIGIVPCFHAVDRLRDLPDDPYSLHMTEAHAINLTVLDDIGPWAGLELLLDMLERLSVDGSLPVHIHLVGQQFPELKAYTGSLMRRVAAMATPCLTFHPSKAAVRATLLRHCDAVLVMQRGAGPGGHSLEALGFGRPVIATPDGDAAELCGPAACCVNVARQFAHELRRLLPDQELLAQLGTAARARFAGQFQTSVLEAGFLDELGAIRERSLVRVDASTIQPGDDWFGIPDPIPLVEAALAAADPLNPAALEGTERRRSFVDWIIREGSRRSPEIMRRLTTPDLLAFATSIEVPPSASQLDAGMRLFWTFDRFAHSAFDLATREGVVRLMRWYQLEAAEGYVACATAALHLDAEHAEHAALMS